MNFVMIYLYTYAIYHTQKIITKQKKDTLITKFILERNENPFSHLMNLDESVHECGKIDSENG